eukprot:764538-Hanusia_phi.AAC.3
MPGVNFLSGGQSLEDAAARFLSCLLLSLPLTCMQQVERDQPSQGEQPLELELLVESGASLCFRLRFLPCPLLSPHSLSGPPAASPRALHEESSWCVSRRSSSAHVTSGSPLPLQEMSELLSKELAIAGAAARWSSHQLGPSLHTSTTFSSSSPTSSSSSSFLFSPPSHRLSTSLPCSHSIAEASTSRLPVRAITSLQPRPRPWPETMSSLRTEARGGGAHEQLERRAKRKGRESLSHLREQVKIVHELEELHAHPHCLRHRLRVHQAEKSNKELRKEEEAAP